MTVFLSTFKKVKQLVKDIDSCVLREMVISPVTFLPMVIFDYKDETYLCQVYYLEDIIGADPIRELQSKYEYLDP